MNNYNYDKVEQYSMDCRYSNKVAILYKQGRPVEILQLGNMKCALKDTYVAVQLLLVFKKSVALLERN